MRLSISGVFSDFGYRIFSWLIVGGAVSISSSAHTAVAEVKAEKATVLPSSRVATSNNTNEIALFAALAVLATLICWARRNPESLVSLGTSLSASLDQGFSFFKTSHDAKALKSAERDRLSQRLALFREQNKAMIFSEMSSASLLGYNYDPDASTPDEFICPITRQIMRVPVVCNGRRYEYAAIKQWYDLGNHTDPFTRAPLSNPHAAEIDTKLRDQIADHLIAKPRPAPRLT